MLYGLWILYFLDFNKAQGVKTVRTDGLDLFYFARQKNASVFYEISCSLSPTSFRALFLMISGKFGWFRCLNGQGRPQASQYHGTRDKSIAQTDGAGYLNESLPRKNPYMHSSILIRRKPPTLRGTGVGGQPSAQPV